MTLADFLIFFFPHNLRKIQKIISKNITEYVYIVSIQFLFSDGVILEKVQRIHL